MPDSAAGRRATCTTCGTKLLVPVPAPVTNRAVGAAAVATSDDDLLLEPETPAGVTRVEQFIPPPAPPRESLYTGPSRAAFDDARAARRRRSYWFDALASFQAPLTPRGFAAIVGLVVVLGLSGFVPGLLGLAAALLAYGVLFAYCFEVIVETAGGEDTLPLPAGIEEWTEIMPGAVIGMLTTFGFVAILPVATAITMAALGAPEDLVLRWSLLAGAASMFLLPVCLLGVAMGGVGVLVRIDMLVRTIFAAPLQYLALWIMLLLSFAVLIGLATVITAGAGVSGPGAAILTDLVASIVAVYFLIVCMRQIGLFYRHFSDRFPWTAG